ncbi:MAG: sigma-70 factor domain-containing protein, partial [Bdellovibrionota bacterium]
MATTTQDTPAMTPAAPKELTVAEQAEAIRDEILRFTKLARDKGFLTIEEINDLLPAEILDASVLDAFMQALEVGGVIITELVAKKEEEGEAGTFLADPSKEEEEDDDDDDKPGEEDAKGNDPVRLYLRKMGSVSLLTREGEVEIARRIEKGEREIVKAILASPIGSDEIIQLGTRLAQGRIKVKAIFRGLEDEETQYNEQEYIDKIHELIGHVQEYKKKAAKYFSVLRQENLNPKVKADNERALGELHGPDRDHAGG